jgi:DNA-binding transcriptional ArsR family regulator
MTIKVVRVKPRSPDTAIGGDVRPTTEDQRDWRARVQRAISHPVREHILLLLAASEATASELTAATGNSRSAVAHHLNVLEECAAVERAQSVSRRGVVYRALIRPIVRTDEGWGDYPLELRRAIFETDVRNIEAHASEALRTGGFDRPDAHVSWTAADVDEAAYAELSALLDETLERVLAVVAGSRRRLAEGETSPAPLDTEIVLMHFLRGGDPPRPADPPATTDDSAFRLLEELDEEITRPRPDWHAVGALAQELSELGSALEAKGTLRGS